MKKVLEVRLTKLEASLIRKLRTLEYGKVTMVIHKVDGQPVRIEIVEFNQSCILNDRDGLDLEGAVYIKD